MGALLTTSEKEAGGAPWGPAVGVWAAGMVALLLGARHFMPLLVDDALISLRYAQRFLDGHGLSWTPGIPVEGYSNLSWVLLSAGLGWLGMDLILAVRVLGIVFHAAVLALLCAAWRPASWARALPALTGVLVFAIAQPGAAWTIAGLEQPLLVAALLGSVVCLFPVVERPREFQPRAVLASSFCLGVLCITRPDGPLFCVTAGVSLLVLLGPNRRGIRTCTWLALFPVLFYFGQLFFRMNYYGEFVPNTARIKVTPSVKHLLTGLGYVGSGLLSFAPFSVLAGAFAVASLAGAGERLKASRPRVVLLVLPTVVWMAYVVFIGGDIFPNYRHMMPVLVLLAGLSAEMVRWLEPERWLAARPTPVALPMVAVALVALFLPHWYMSKRDPENERSLTEFWEWEGQVVGTALKRAFGDKQPLLAVDAAGTTPYFSELPTIDMLGLSDFHIARHKPADLGTGRIGHEHGDGLYVLLRRPDIVTFGHLWFKESRERSGHELVAHPRFAMDYTWVDFVAEEPFRYKWGLWIRRFSEKIGIRVLPDRTVVPGFLFNGEWGARMVLNDRGRFVSPVGPEKVASIQFLTLPAGEHRVEADATVALWGRLERAGDGALLAEGPLPLEFSVAGDRVGVVHLTVGPLAGERGELRQVTVFQASAVGAEAE